MTTEQTGTDLVFASAALKDRMEWARAIAGAGELVPAGLRNRDGSPNPAKILLVAETGSMLQIHPMAAIQGIHVIEGKPTISAGLMSALVRRAGHKLRVSKKGNVADGTFEATATLIRADDPTFEYTATWNLERAKRAGLAGKGNWNKYFEAQCKARSISEVVREGAEDVLMGNAYAPEDFGAVMTDAGELIREDLIEDAELVEDEAPKPAAAPTNAAKPRAGAPKAAVEDETAVKHVVADEWIGRVTDTDSLSALFKLHEEAAERRVLDHRTSEGRSVEEAFLERREALQNPVTVPDYDDETPF